MLQGGVSLDIAPTCSSRRGSARPPGSACSRLPSSSARPPVGCGPILQKAHDVQRRPELRQAIVVPGARDEIPRRGRRCYRLYGSVPPKSPIVPPRDLIHSRIAAPSGLTYRDGAPGSCPGWCTWPPGACRPSGSTTATSLGAIAPWPGRRRARAPPGGRSPGATCAGCDGGATPGLPFRRASWNGRAWSGSCASGWAWTSSASIRAASIGGGRPGAPWAFPTAPSPSTWDGWRRKEGRSPAHRLARSGAPHRRPARAGRRWPGQAPP